MIMDALVEGLIDEAVARRIIVSSGHEFGVCYGKKGIGYIQQKIQKFNASAPRGLMLTLVDFMDTQLFCPPDVVHQWLPHRHPNMIFRVVVKEIESWLLADRVNFADFLHVSLSRIPANPEQLDDPKQTVVNLARHSRSKHIKEALMPGRATSAPVGKLYASEMISFIQNQWDVRVARGNAPSLNRCMSKLER